MPYLPGADAEEPAAGYRLQGGGLPEDCGACPADHRLPGHECREHFEELKSLLDELGIPYEVDTGIVRGLDYYTKTVFEFVNSEGFTLCGGGRYDGLIHEIDEKQDIPSVGFGMGIERILYFLERKGWSFRRWRSRPSMWASWARRPGPGV